MERDPFGGAAAHCAEHARFVPGCAVCRRARASHEPYPVRPGTVINQPNALWQPPAGKRNLLERWTDVRAEDDLGSGLSRKLVRGLWKLVWPF